MRKMIHLKVGLIRGKFYNTRQKVRTAILEYIEVFFNWQPHLPQFLAREMLLVVIKENTSVPRIK